MLCAKLLQACLTLCDPRDCSPSGPSCHGMLQASVLEGLPRPPPGGLPDPGAEPASPALQVDSLSDFTHSSVHTSFHPSLHLPHPTLESMGPSCTSVSLFSKVSLLPEYKITSSVLLPPRPNIPPLLPSPPAQGRRRLTTQATPEPAPEAPQTGDREACSPLRGRHQLRSEFNCKKEFQIPG